MTVQEVIQRALAAYDAGELDAYAACYAEDAVMIMNGDQPVRGRAAIRRQAAAEKTAFPDMKLDRSLFVPEGQWVAWRWRLRGTHDGDYEPWAATHRTVDV